MLAEYQLRTGSLFVSLYLNDSKANVPSVRVAVFFAALACGAFPVGFVFAAVGHTGTDHPVAAILLSALLPALFWLVVQRFLRGGEAEDKGEESP